MLVDMDVSTPSADQLQQDAMSETPIPKPLNKASIESFLDASWPLLQGTDHRDERADFVLAVLSVPRKDLPAGDAQAIEQVVRLAREDDDPYVRALGTAGVDRTAKGIWDLDYQSVAPTLHNAYGEIKKSLESAIIKFHAPEVPYLSNRVIDTIYQGGAKALASNNEVKLNIRSNFTVPLLSKRLMSYGFKKMTAGASPQASSPSINTAGFPPAPSGHSPSPGAAPETPAWMLKNRAPALKEAAYGTRRTSAGPTKSGLQREEKVALLNVNDVIEEERKAREAKQKEVDEKRLAKERIQQEKEEKKLEKQRLKEAKAREKAEADAERRARVQEAQEARALAAAERQAAQAAQAAAREAALAQRRDEDEQAQREMLEAARQEEKEQTHIEEKRSASSDDEDAKPANKRRRTSVKQEQPASPEGNDDMVMSSNASTPPPDNNVDAGSAINQYDRLVGNEELPEEEEQRLRAFLSGDFESHKRTHLIELSEFNNEQGERRRRVIKLDYASGSVKLLTKSIGGTKRRRPVG